ncbi:hypothetical protein [Paenibacillus sp. GXUN7292]|uniref:hypothetical protein n=1 Tax=Paenibacillus sp. GXUN7292 TaxID=3422499 RepID=UPI003D7E182B
MSDKLAVSTIKKPKKLTIGKIDIQITAYKEETKDDRLIIKCRGLMKDFEKYSHVFMYQRSKLSPVLRKGIDESPLIMIAELIHWGESEKYSFTHVEFFLYETSDEFDNDILTIETDLRLYNLQKQLDYQSRLIESLYGLLMRNNIVPDSEILHSKSMAAENHKFNYNNKHLDEDDLSQVVPSIKEQGYFSLL